MQSLEVTAASVCSVHYGVRKQALVPVFVEHNVVQSDSMALTVHGSIVSTGVCSYARQLGVARKPR